MSRPASIDDTERAPRRGLSDHPLLQKVLDRIAEELVARDQLGLLSVSALRREGPASGDRWSDYESMLTEISSFLTRFCALRMRATDVFLDPLIVGNTFVVLMGPPREQRSLDRADLQTLRQRLRRELADHVAACTSLDSSLVERYGVYVGGALIEHDPLADTPRAIYRGLEESVADALEQSLRDQDGDAERLDRVIRTRSVSAVYQPVVDIVRHEVIGYEALTRLPQGQFRTPDALFRAARHVGTLWSIERLCRRRALETLPRIAEHQKLFLNIEPNSFYDPDLRATEFRELIESAGLQPHNLVFELTEHEAVKDFDALNRALAEVRSLGFRLALDDVGSGHAGLQTIAEIRPDYLKIDMSLIRDIHRDPVKRELIATIRRFADATGSTLVAEGVESQAEMISLIETGVRCAQGFLFARPESPPATPDWNAIAVNRPRVPK